MPDKPTGRTVGNSITKIPTVIRMRASAITAITLIRANTTIISAKVSSAVMKTVITDAINTADIPAADTLF